ncbi:hypothetical protein KJ652_04655 [Patescibacteria group bacterium]|nr:hypothetical protein [Patescibacteria group bacterium]MBU1123855.1 hypothetical protein [Patescibacteria group bacterium]MBU1911124.1 hypothetical protein [Patescibacteria group bacterium]
MHKILIPLFALAILLTSCGGGGSSTVECENEYWDSTVGTCLPDGWVVIDRETLKMRGVPEETVAAFRREESVSGQFPSITVTKEVLSAAVSAATYSDASIRSVSVLPNYTVVESPSVKIDGEEVTLHIFSAQPVPDEPARRFYQISTVKGDIGFSITAAAPISVEKNLEEEIEFIMKGVTFERGEEE